MWILGAYIILSPLWWILGAREIALRGAVNKLFDYLILAVIFVFIFRSIRVIEEQVRVWGERTPGEMNDLLADLAGRSLRILFPVVALILVLPLLGLPEKYDTIIAKGSGFLIIGTISWILIHGVRFLEKAIMSRFDISAKDNLQARKVYTQVSVLRKTLIFIVIVFTAASMLMMFEEVRRLGTSILASAGVIGLIVGFAAQKTIANLFAGIQIAITQPIRLDDVVIVENEWGRIEEITLTYVVVRIWDLRRLVVPINYFIDNPFQNWTRVSADILGAVYLYTDYRLPIDSVREEFKRLCKESEFWDGKVCVLAVTNATERAMEVRALASAADASLAWNLRCELREKLITFIQANYPECLPKTRALIEKADAEKK
ncbi:MAG: mechanosensitive ion channel family protein [Verrucomicrobia bacterium]|nr:mechanosensitive ion channel family protein [Verrucomicrobiota bacterium]MCF7709127.1 mechanosensitive ion channel family protein [Verrucomicrobiota bacterium]